MMPLQVLNSYNFIWTSLHRNREVGILLGNPIAARLDRQCLRDWAAAR